MKQRSSCVRKINDIKRIKVRKVPTKTFAGYTGKQFNVALSLRPDFEIGNTYQHGGGWFTEPNSLSCFGRCEAEVRPHLINLLLLCLFSMPGKRYAT